ncbi:uncharacterized protein LOC121738861 [Aricia agestis]|uniref:uncharacterized protein LOC121738861 n=1 Tax=Aricia agestis TaxID=91739 RepID=UPI001C20320C|nr:uncharacterized protein LOC121738861 [Aricia agestis]XP_041987055.1 uncharacterized protein LOC121738861 [Aricia agestis]
MSHPKNEGKQDSKNPDAAEKFIYTEDSVSSEGPSGRNNLKRIIRNDKYVPTNSKSSTISDRPTEMGSASDFNITKNTLHVVGSNPGEPKMSYQDPPYKTSKTTKNLHKVDKRKKDSNAGKMISYATVRGILKDERYSPECTGDSSFRGDEEYTESLQYAVTYEPHGLKSAEKNVSFDTQVHIFHFTGDLCVGQSVETLSKEVDQQERNSELRKTFMKYNEQWPKGGKRK